METTGHVLQFNWIKFCRTSAMHGRLMTTVPSNIKGSVVLSLPFAVSFCWFVHSLGSRMSPRSLIHCCPIFVAREFWIHFCCVHHVRAFIFTSAQFPMWHVLSTFASLSTGMKGQFIYLISINGVAIRFLWEPFTCLFPSNTEVLPDLHLNTWITDGRWQ